MDDFVKGPIVWIERIADVVDVAVGPEEVAWLLAGEPIHRLLAVRVDDRRYPPGDRQRRERPRACDDDVRGMDVSRTEVQPPGTNSTPSAGQSPLFSGVPMMRTVSSQGAATRRS